MLMANDVFVLVLALGLIALLGWGFRTLPREEWQILAALPRDKRTDDEWRGLNLTYYGLLSASATTIATALLLVLLGAVAFPLPASLLITGAMLAVGLPAARIIARIVERKPSTFTVGGASFAVLVLAPWLLWLADRPFRSWFAASVPMVPALAALVIAYAFGESIGRL